MKLDYTLICEHAMADKDNKISAIGIFDVISGTRFPITVPVFFVICSFSAENLNDVGVKQITLFIQRDDGNGVEKVVELNGSLNIESIEKKANFFAKFLMVPFNNIGNYTLKIIVDGESYEGSKIKISQ
jgi:hypothetical protein